MSKKKPLVIGWTSEQDAELMKLAGTMPSRELAEMLGRNFRQMQVRASHLGVSLAFNRTYTEWTTGQDARLLRFWEDKLNADDLVEIAETVGIYEVTCSELTHDHVATWLSKTRPAVRGRLAKFKREGEKS